MAVDLTDISEIKNADCIIVAVAHNEYKNMSLSDYNNSSEVPWYGWREEIHSVVIESGITRIGNYAFIYCGGLEEIKLSEGLEEESSYQCLVLQV